MCTLRCYFLNQKLFLEQIAYEFYKSSILEKKNVSKNELLSSLFILQEKQDFKNFYDAFDENGRCVLSETAKKTYSFFCCDRTTFINFDIVFSKETIAYLKFQLKYSAILKLLENFWFKIIVYFSIYF